MAEAATRGALLGLRDEERAMQEGYELLDQKRILLVQEIKQQLADYEKEKSAFAQAYREAMDMLHRAVGRHGLEGLAAYPSLHWDGQPEIRSRNLMGVRLQSVRFDVSAEAGPPADNPSPEANDARQLFLQVTQQVVPLAAREANLHRLLAEYRRTEHRARALEEVLLPELRQRIKEMASHLEDIDQEEALRVIGHQPKTRL
jgi:V/A-type H+/Na+-transporting ATPase subunit D